MAILTEDMKRVVREQGLGFRNRVQGRFAEPVAEGDHASVGRRPPLLRGHPLAADSRQHPTWVAREINVVDPFVRKGYRFKGPAVVHDPGTDGFVDGLNRLRNDGLTTLLDRVRAIVVIEVQEASELVSPATTMAPPPRQK